MENSQRGFNGSRSKGSLRLRPVDSNIYFQDTFVTWLDTVASNDCIAWLVLNI